MIQVRAIGAAEVQIGRKRITKSTEMVLALAVYLCMRAGERLTRDEIVDVFWPGRDIAKGRHSLRQMLYRLRLKGFTLDEEGEELHLDPSRVDCDATRALAEDWPEAAVAWLVEDSDEFLPGLTREVSPQFQEWLDSTRSRVTTQYRRAALRQIAQARREGRWVDLERWGMVVLRSDPLNEEATLARAESAAMAGSKAMALEILDQYVEDLGERAGQIALPATVLRRRISERRPEWGGRGAQEVRLVGRSELMRRLTAALTSAGRGEGSAVLLFGAPGIGKTRLANELREFAVISGFRVCSVRATQSEAGRPLALAIAVAMTVRDLPGVAGTSPAALALISRLCEPTTRAREPDVPLAHTISPLDIGWALSDAVSAASHESRLLLTIDDLHNADDLSKEVLTALAQTASSQRLLLLATGRSTSRHQLSGQTGPLRDFRSLAVPPLSLSDATLLVSEFAVSPQRPLSSQTTAAITRAAGGNPLFLRELTSQRLSQHIVLSAPQSLVEVIEQRTAHLSPTEIRLLRLISTLGQLATLERIRTLMPSSLGDYDASLEQLELEGVLCMSATGSLELHECWHDSLRGALKGTARSAISLDCATLLSAELFTDANFSNYWRAAELFAIAGSNDRSRQQFLLVGDRFTKRGLPRQATEALSQAVALAGDGSGREALLTQLAAAQNSASLYSESIDSCMSALSLAADPTPESASTRTLALATLVDSQMKLGVDYGESIGALAVAVSHTEVTDSVCQHACLIALRTIFNSGSRISPQVFLEASLQSTSRSGRSVLGSLVRLIYAAERGTATELTHLERELTDGAAAGGTPSMRLLTLRYRGTALRFLGRYEEAVIVMNEAVATARALGAVRDSFLATTSLVFLHLDYANFEQARAWLDQAEALAGPAQGHDLDRTLLHATARYFVDTGNDAACVATYADHLDAVYSDTIMRRAVVDRACLALAFARTGDALAARQACAATIRMLGDLSPGINEDWAASTVLRSLYSLGEVSQAETLRAAYRTRRAKHFDRPIPTGLKELSATSDD